MIHLIFKALGWLVRLLFGRPGGYLLDVTVRIKTEVYGAPFTLYDSAGYVVAVHHLGGLMELCAGYQWDGASGPTWDTESTYWASAVHDAFYEAISSGQLPMVFRKPADQLLRDMMRDDGAGRVRSWYYWAAVRLFGRFAIDRK